MEYYHYIIFCFVTLVLISICATLGLLLDSHLKLRAEKITAKKDALSPKTISFETLLRILHSYRSSNKNKEFQNFINKVQYNIDIIKQNLNETDYNELLMNYEFTFARIESIIEESNNLNNDAYNKVLISSIEVIDSFLEKCKLLTEKKIKIEQDIEKATLNRLLSEINEEKALLNRKSPKI
jgi:hypothetical protein